MFIDCGQNSQFLNQPNFFLQPLVLARKKHTKQVNGTFTTQS
jgi:hypothetical protein